MKIFESAELRQEAMKSELAGAIRALKEVKREDLIHFAKVSVMKYMEDFGCYKNERVELMQTVKTELELTDEEYKVLSEQVSAETGEEIKPAEGQTVEGQVLETAAEGEDGDIEEEQSIFTACSTIGAVTAVIGGAAMQVKNGASLAASGGTLVAGALGYFVGDQLEKHLGRTTMAQVSSAASGLLLGTAAATAAQYCQATFFNKDEAEVENAVDVMAEPVSLELF